MMNLTLQDVRRIAADVARQQDPAVEVIGATRTEGESSYAEVMFAVHGCRVELCRLIIGVHRNSERKCRSALREGLREYRAKSRPRRRVH